MISMVHLLKIEFRKILTYKIFWILVGLYFLFLSAGLLLAEFMVNKMVDDMNRHMPIPFPHVTIYFFPDIWQNIAFFATIRYVLIFPAIVIIILVTNEFMNKTIRQNVINGMSKAEFITSKLLLIILISLTVTVLIAVVTLILGISHTSGLTWEMVTGKAVFIVGFFITMFAVQVFALFFGFLFRNTGLSIAMFTLYMFIVEPIVYYFLKSPLVFENNISTYLPMNSVLRVTEYPHIDVLKKVMGLSLQDTVTLEASLIALAYSAVMIAIVYWTVARKDL